MIQCTNKNTSVKTNEGFHTRILVLYLAKVSAFISQLHFINYFKIRMETHAFCRNISCAFHAATNQLIIIRHTSRQNVIILHVLALYSCIILAFSTQYYYSNRILFINGSMLSLATLGLVPVTSWLAV